MFLWYENEVRMIDTVSKAVPSLLLRYTFVLLGLVTALVGLLWLLELILFFPLAQLPAHWWVNPVVFLAYGLFVFWCTQIAKKSRKFRSTPSLSTAGKTHAKKK